MLQPSCTVIVHDNWREGDGNCESLSIDNSQAKTVANNLLLSSTHSVQRSQKRKIKCNKDFHPWYDSRSGHLLVYKSKAPVIATKLVNLWCSSQVPNTTGNQLYKEFPSISSNFKKVDIEEVKSKWKISSHQRGKWVITQESLEAQEGTEMTLSKGWKKICSYIQAGNLPHANAVFKIRSKEICVFCDVKHFHKVWSVLRCGLGNIGSIAFEVHPHGPIMTL